MLNLRFGCRRWQTSLLYTLFSVFVLVALAGFTAQKVDAGTPLTAMVPLDSPVTLRLTPRGCGRTPPICALSGSQQCVASCREIARVFFRD